MKENSMQTLIQNFAPPALSNKSFFLCFEGLEGAGKTTQIEKLKQALEKEDWKVTVLREPGGTLFGENLRKAILEQKNQLHPLAEAYLFASSRVQLLDEVILPQLKTPGNIILLDRYLASSCAYQGVARGLGLSSILEIHTKAPLTTLPHLCLYLDIDLPTSLARLKARGQNQDYFEQEKENFFQKVHQGYLEYNQIFSPWTRVIEGKRSPELVFADIYEAFKNLEKS